MRVCRKQNVMRGGRRVVVIVLRRRCHEWPVRHQERNVEDDGDDDEENRREDLLGKGTAGLRDTPRAIHLVWCLFGHRPISSFL